MVGKVVVSICSVSEHQLTIKTFKTHSVNVQADTVWIVSVHKVRGNDEEEIVLHTARTYRSGEVKITAPISFYQKKTS